MTTTTPAGVPPEPADLRARQQALLADCDLLDVPDDAELDAVTRLAAAVTGFPITMVNLLETERACQLSTFGFPRMHTERDTSLCHRASLIGGVVTSDECTTDPRFADLPWVDGRWAAVRRYASAPLVVDGLTIGTLCFFDQEPGPALTDVHRAHMADLASVVVSLLERRRDNRRVEASREQLRQAHAELVRSRAFESALLEALPVGIVAADADRRVTLRNRVSRHWVECADLDVPLDRLFEEGAVDGVEVQVGGPDGSALTVACTGSRVLGDGGELLGAVVVMADVTAQRAVEAQLRTAASCDALTGLANRARFVEQLRRSAEEGEVAVVFCDLDGFKAVNDVHGHAAGDAVLVETAARLAGAVRRGDLVARLGGDEFVVLCPGHLSPRDLSSLLRRIEAAVSRPVLLAGVPVRVGVSVGTAMSGGATDPEELLRAADAAMYEVKRSRHRTS